MMTDTKPHYQFSVYQPVEVVDCLCSPTCAAVHRRHTGRKFVTFEAEGHRFTAELLPGTDKWEELPDA